MDWRNATSYGFGQRVESAKGQQAQLDKLKQQDEVVEEESNHEPIKDTIGYDDFVKMDIRVARILEAEKVPKTDKLLKLTLDLGNEKRTVVSGIAEHYDPESIIGTQVSLLANLAPRKLRGILSEGMILMAEDGDGKLSFVGPDQSIDEGSVIR